MSPTAATTRLRQPEPANTDPGDPAADAVSAALSHGLDRMKYNEPLARRGEVEGVHGMRTATRRLRSALRTFRPLLDGDWGDPLEKELHWLAQLLGAVRDLDVLTARLHEAEGDAGEALQPLFRSLEARHKTASAALRKGLASARYQALRAGLESASARPELSDCADDVCRKVLPPLVARSWTNLKKRARALGPDDPDERFHDVRKRAKRARYAAEAVAEALDPSAARDARRFAERAADVQDVLGGFQDAIVAQEEVERIVADHPGDGPFNLAAGRLLEREACAAARLRAQFFKTWDKLDRRSNRRWLKP